MIWYYILLFTLCYSKLYFIILYYIIWYYIILYYIKLCFLFYIYYCYFIFYCMVFYYIYWGIWDWIKRVYTPVTSAKHRGVVMDRDEDIYVVDVFQFSLKPTKLRKARPIANAKNKHNFDVSKCFLTYLTLSHWHNFSRCFNCDSPHRILAAGPISSGPAVGWNPGWSNRGWCFCRRRSCSISGWAGFKVPSGNLT